MANDKIIHTSTDSFDAEVISASEAVLVDFWAIWCGPCKAIAPLLDQAADQYAGKVKIAKVDVDKHGALAAKYGVRNIPTLLLFKGGQVVGTHVGTLNKSALDSFLAKAV